MEGRDDRDDIDRVLNVVASVAKELRKVTPGWREGVCVCVSERVSE